MFKLEHNVLSMPFSTPTHGDARHGGSVAKQLLSRMACKPHHTENTHYKVLRLLEANPKMNQRELSQALGVSLGKTNYCLKALLDKGMLKVHNFHNSKHKLAYAYLLTPAGITEKSALAGRFLQRKMTEFEQLKSEIESLQQETYRNS